MRPLGTLRLVLGDQITDTLSSLTDMDPARDTVLLAEVMDEATYVAHHKQKFVLVFSAMRQFAERLRARGDHGALCPARRSGCDVVAQRRGASRAGGRILRTSGGHRAWRVAPGRRVRRPRAALARAARDPRGHPVHLLAPPFRGLGRRANRAAHGVLLPRDAARDGAADGGRQAGRRSLELRSGEPQAPAEGPGAAAAHDHPAQPGHPGDAGGDDRAVSRQFRHGGAVRLRYQPPRRPS